MNGGDNGCDNEYYPTNKLRSPKWNLSKKRKEFCVFADLSNTFHHPPRLLPRVIEQQVNFLIHYKSDCGYKGNNIAYAMAEIS